MTKTWIASTCLIRCPQGLMFGPLISSWRKACACAPHSIALLEKNLGAGEWLLDNIWRNDPWGEDGQAQISPCRQRGSQHSEEERMHHTRTTAQGPPMYRQSTEDRHDD